MPKLPRTGAGYQCLYEREFTLLEVTASLGLKPLSKKAQRQIRERLGFAIATWEEPHPAIEIDDIVRLLKRHACSLDKVARLGAVAKGGRCRTEEIETAVRVAQALSEIPAVSSLGSAYDYLEDFCDRALVIASACLTAAKELQLTRGIAGRPPHHWYDEFTAILLDICKQNRIEPTAGLDRSSGKPVGGLYEVAAAFERLLLPKMRSSTSQALIKRLQRSLERLTAEPA